MTDKIEYTRHLLARTGDRQLSFFGILISSASTWQHGGPCESRHWSLELFSTQDGRYVLHIKYETRWQGELDNDFAVVVPSADKLTEALDEYDWAQKFYGFPQGHEARQAELVRRLGDCWDRAVSELLAVVEPENL